jgi:hypothetical protein
MTVIIQAIVMGVVGSVAGIGLGWGMVKLIAAGMSQIGSPLTGASNPTASDIVIGLLVGVCVSLVGAALPARHASIAPPLQAMNETVNPEKPTRLRAILGGVMCVLGIISWVFTIQLTNAKDGLTPWKAVNDMNAGWPLGVGAAFIVIGFIVLSPALVTMVSRVLGWPPSLVFPVTGKLATREPVAFQTQNRQYSRSAVRRHRHRQLPVGGGILGEELGVGHRRQWTQIRVRRHGERRHGHHTRCRSRCGEGREGRQIGYRQQASARREVRRQERTGIHRDHRQLPVHRRVHTAGPRRRPRSGIEGQ